MSIIRYCIVSFSLAALLLLSGCVGRNRGASGTPVAPGDGQTPTVTPTPVPLTSADNPYRLGADQPVVVRRYGVVFGDVLVNGEVMYDNDANTALLIIVSDDATVEAPYAATVFTELDRDRAEQIAQSGANEMKRSGCLGGCDRVDVIRWPGDPPQS